MNAVPTFSFGLNLNSSCMACETLKNLDLPDVKILEAQTVEDGTAHCKILGRISKEIHFELLLPESWNERFLMSGGGGFSGSIQNGGKSRLKDGYACAGTDTGHKGLGIKADWALNNMERQLNFGRLAIHRTAVVSKAIISAYYCDAPAYSYFVGCSRGGGQALIEAQLFAEDFDGIVAAAPIIDWPGTGAEFIRNMQVLYPDTTKLDRTILDKSDLQLLQHAVLEQCDIMDGVKDNILNDPRDCNLNYSKLPKCPSGPAASDCLSALEVQAIQTIYGGTIADGIEVYPGFPIGCENEKGAWDVWITGPDASLMSLGFPSLHFAFGTEMFKYLVFNDADWDYTKYDFTHFNEETEYAASYLNATSTDYSEFKKRNGKMIIYHGWNDPALSAFTAIDHYEESKAIDSELNDYIRLFLLPGVLHCGGGPGPSEADWLALVSNWVEEGVAPDRVVVSKKKDGETIMSRPVFPYPQKAKYDGKGDSNLESSFVRSE